MSVITSGNGTQMGVTSDARALVHARTNGSTLDQVLEGWAFTITEDTVTPTGANDFLALRNNAAEPAVVTRIQLTDAGAETLTLNLAANYTIAGTNAVPDESYNRSGATNALATKMQAAVGVTVTGTGAVLSPNVTFTTGAGTEYDNILEGNQVIVIPPGQTLTFAAGTGTAAITTVAIDVHYLMAARTDS